MKNQGSVESRSPSWSSDGGDEQQRADEHGEPDAGRAATRSAAQADRRGQRHGQAGQHGRRADDPEIPLPVGRPHERAEQAVRAHRRRGERPGVGAEPGRRHRDEHAERRPAAPRAPTLAPVPAIVALTVAGSSGSRAARMKLDATASTTHVIGSSKKPL